MKMKLVSFLLVLFFLFVFQSELVFGCESSGCVLVRSGDKEWTKSKPWFFDFTMEQQNWHVKNAHDAHLLHHQGHDFHDKTHEEFYHFTVGANASDYLTILAEMPYVVRGSLEVENHKTLGQREESQGLGDLNLTGIYRFLKKGKNSIGLVAGVKFPTGSTNEENSQGILFEPELQPGTGGTDFTIGTAFGFESNGLGFHGNVLYTFKTKGAQEYEFGDLFSSYLVIDYAVNPSSTIFQTRFGLDANWQIEGKNTDHHVKVADSGGQTVLLGPAITIKANDTVSVFGNFLFPIHQDLGGVHQKLDYVWNVGCKIDWF